MRYDYANGRQKNIEWLPSVAPPHDLLIQSQASC
jgi:hypothetical protein